MIKYFYCFFHVKICLKRLNYDVAGVCAVDVFSVSFLPKSHFCADRIANFSSMFFDFW